MLPKFLLFIFAFSFLSCATKPSPNQKGLRQNTLADEDINTFVDDNSADIKFCYEKVLLKNGNVKIRVVMSWEVTPKGEVEKVKVESIDKNNPEFEKCMIENISNWLFPSFTGYKNQKVLYPFNLYPMEGTPLGLCYNDKKNFRCVQYVRNYGAARIIFNINNVHSIIANNLSVQVSGLRAPRIDGKAKCEKTLASKGQKFSHDFLKQAKRIDLKNISRGEYFKINAQVIADGKSLKEELIKNKLAVTYKKQSKAINWCSP